ncbi:hypothetical protein [Sphingomonas daechungensis]|uniref:hypothetical protein n=1 Tax=Sphingomonas daechungensis TaxID=1176646 RepID=UPI00378439FD
MFILFASVLAASASTPAQEPAAQAKPRKKCEYVSEVGSNRPRRVCQVIAPKAPETPVEADAKQKAAEDHSGHQAGAEE